MIPLSVPFLNGNEWKYVRECLDTNWVSYQGPFVDKFERALAEECGSARAVVTVSGTAALHLALVVAGVEHNTEVVMPGITFASPAHAVRYCGAWPVCVDLREDDWQWDTALVRQFLEEGCERRSNQLTNRRTGRRISAIMPVHLLGDMCDVDDVAALGHEFGLPVVEDAAECIGARYRGRGLAAPTPNIDPKQRLVCSSFNGNKIMTTGGGGVVFSNDEEVADRIRHLSTTAKVPGPGFFHDEIGFNYRLTNIGAALGMAQLEQLPEFLKRKRGMAYRYAQNFAGQKTVRSNPKTAWTDPSWWLYTVTVNSPSALEAVRQLNGIGIGARPLWTPIYRLPKFEKDVYVASNRVSEWLFDHAVSLPSSVGITNQEIDEVAAAVRSLASSESHPPTV